MSLVEQIALPPNGSTAPVATDPRQIGEDVRKETLEVLVASELIKQEECDGFDQYLVGTKAPVGDILPLMAELREIEYSLRSEALEQWGRKMGQVLKKRTPLVPFGSKLLNTTAIYEQFPKVFQCARVSKCPILFSEDSDVIGIGVINPVAGVIAARYFSALIQEETGVAPFISTLLLNLSSWEQLCERHFES